VQGVQLAEFYELGLGEVYPVSAAHGQGIRGLIDLALAPLQLLAQARVASAPTRRRSSSARPSRCLRPC